MRLTQYLVPTLREDPAEAEIVSHRLMLRAGMIVPRRLTTPSTKESDCGTRVTGRSRSISRTPEISSP